MPSVWITSSQFGVFFFLAVWLSRGLKLRARSALELPLPSGRGWANLREADHGSGNMASRPSMIRQYSQQLAARVRADGWKRVEVRGNVQASLSGRDERQ